MPSYLAGGRVDSGVETYIGTLIENVEPTNEVIVERPGAILVPGCRLVAHNSDGVTNFLPADHRTADEAGMIAGDFRVAGVAARHLFDLQQLAAIEQLTGQQLEPVPIIALGGKTLPLNNADGYDPPTEAKAMYCAIDDYLTKELAKKPALKTLSDRYGPPVIMYEGIDPHAPTLKTHGNMRFGLAYAASIIMDNDPAWHDKRRLVEAVTNTYHVVRTAMMGSIALQSLGYNRPANNVKSKTFDLRLLSAELLSQSLFAQSDPGLAATQDAAYDSEIGRLRLRNEFRGVLQLLEHTYGKESDGEPYGLPESNDPDVLQAWMPIMAHHFGSVALSVMTELATESKNG